MEFQEYPKAVYLGGDTQADCKIVNDTTQEVSAAADGYAPIGVAVAPTAVAAPVRRTRGPNKAK